MSEANTDHGCYGWPDTDSDSYSSDIGENPGSLLYPLQGRQDNKPINAVDQCMVRAIAAPHKCMMSGVAGDTANSTKHFDGNFDLNEDVIEASFDSFSNESSGFAGGGTALANKPERPKRTRGKRRANRRKSKTSSYLWCYAANVTYIGSRPLRF